MLSTDSPAYAEAAALVCDSGRLAPFRFVHKALRAMLAESLQRVGALDACYPDDRALIIDAVLRLLRVCSQHIAHQDEFFLAPLARRAPRAALPFDDDHRNQLTEIAALRQRLAAVQVAGPSARSSAYGLYLALTRFAAEQLEHLAEEDTLLTRALWEHFSDDEIRAMQARMHADFTPEQSGFYLQWMTQALDVSELGDLVAEARASMSASAFDSLLEIMRGEMPAPRWTRLAQTIDVAHEAWRRAA